MAVTFNYLPEAQSVAEAAFQGGRGEAVRENTADTLHRQLQADQSGLQAQIHREDRYVQNQRLAQNDLLDYAVAQQNNERYLQQHQLDNETRQQNAQEATIRAGLKDGTFYYSPDQVDKSERILRSVSQVEADPSIDDELKSQMVEEQMAEYHRIRQSPRIRLKPQNPTPAEQFSQRSVRVSDGKVFAMDDPNAPPDSTVMTMNRSGAFQPLKNPNAPTPQAVAAEQKARFDYEFKVWNARLKAAAEASKDVMNETAAEKARREYEQLRDNPPQFGGGGQWNVAPQGGQQAQGGRAVVLHPDDEAGFDALPPGTIVTNSLTGEKFVK